MMYDLTPDQHALCELMSDISERCYSAGWMLNLEYALWDAMLHGVKPYGQHEITVDDIDQLKQLSQKASCWIYFDDVTEETAIDFQSWEIKFEKQPKKNNFY